MSTRMERMTERLRPANQMKIGRKAGETVQLTRARAAPGRPSNRSNSATAAATSRAILSSKLARKSKAVERARQLDVAQKMIRAALGGQTPITERGAEVRATPPILPPDFQG